MVMLPCSSGPAGTRWLPARRAGTVALAVLVFLGLVACHPVVAEGPSTTRPDGSDLWSLQPLGTPSVPEARGSAHPIDRFIDASLARQGLRRAPEADRRTLVRRAAWDLTGLPPTVEEVSAGLQGSPEDGGSSFDRLVERWLASPAYGERWGRWWLDLARYADTNGQDENKVMANAWRYRDWVVRSFNANQPYDEFLRDQLAGDLVDRTGVPESVVFDRWTATGFLVLGPKMLAEQDKPKLVMDLVDEQIDVVGRAFLGLTLQCARCHDHKFDPVSASDYYALAGIFRSTKTMENLAFVSKFNERGITPAGRLAAIEAHRSTWKRLQEEHDATTRSARQRLRQDWREALLNGLPEWLRDEPVGAKASRPADGPEARWRAWWQGGSVSPAVRQAVRELAADPGARQVWAAASDDGIPRAELRLGPGRLGQGFRAGGDNHLDHPSTPALEPAQWTLQAWVRAEEWPKGGETRCWLISKNANEWAEGHYALGLDGEHAMAWLNIGGGREHAVTVRAPKPLKRDHWHHLVATYDGRTLALFVDGLAAGGTEVGKVRVPGTGPVSLARRPDGHVRFRGLLDEVLVVGEAWTADRVRQAFEAPEQVRAWPALLRWDFDHLNPDETREAARAEAREAIFGGQGPLALPKDPRPLFPEVVRDALVRNEQQREAHQRQDPGAPAHTLAVEEGTVADLPIHVRGSHLQLAAHPVPRGFPQAIRVSRSPSIPAGQSGRLELAHWLTRPDHPLTARVLVNRVWQAHFGHGLVRSPDNFGRRGDRPTHPELLDWLARDVIDHGWDVKRLHRLILGSATWRQAGRIHADPKGADLDPENRWLWHFPRQRLEAEMIRDGVLAVAGRLDRTLGGSLVSWKNDEYAPKDDISESSLRRTVYLPVVRDRVYDLLTLFDFANPSVGVSRRTPTVVSHQALFWMNSPWVKEQSRALAALLAGDPGTPHRPVAERVERAYQRVLSRPPTPVELARASAFLEGPGVTSADPDSTARWAGWCQVLLASSEFQYRE